MKSISLEESLRRNGDAGAAAEIVALRADSNKYHRVMGLLRDMLNDHGKCHPRARRACTHCNAKDDLDRLLAEYKGPTVTTMKLNCETATV